MTFKDTFCPSPWIHMRINNSGHYEYCRWAVKSNRNSEPSVQQETPLNYFRNGMAPIRQALLDGEALPGCSECYLQEQHSKVSGRQKQLLKVGVQTDDFANTMLSSPWINEFKNTVTEQTPQDWQIDLGNYCNSSCIFCTPDSSSRLASEYKRIGLIKEIPRANWCEDPALLESFINDLSRANIKYLHFIGGETLITPAFKKILSALVDKNLHTAITIGFTTNLTVWDEEITNLLGNFEQINLGMSIECIHRLNDYVRYGSNIDKAVDIMEKWIAVAREKNWLIQLRITPTVFSIWHLDTVYEYAYQNNLAVESCNFLNDPDFMRPSLLPDNMRQVVIDKLSSWVAHTNQISTSQVVNIRNPGFARQQTVEDARSYINYLKNQPNESQKLPALVDYIKLLELSRNNTILDYLPEYEELLRSAGY